MYVANTNYKCKLYIFVISSITIESGPFFFFFFIHFILFFCYYFIIFLLKRGKACSDRGLLQTRRLLIQWFPLAMLKSSHRTFYGRHHHLVDCYGISVTNDHGYEQFVVNSSRSIPHSWVVAGFVTRLSRRVSLVEHDLPTLPEHLSS